MTAQKPGFLSRVDQFFFEPEVPYSLALCRILLPICLMGLVLPRWNVVRELFSTDGAPAQLSAGFGFGEMLPEFSATVAVALFGVLVFTLISAAIGWRTRISLMIATVLFSYFTLLDYVSTMTKYTVISTHLLAILSVSHCGSLWSVDAWLARRNRGLDAPAIGYERFPAWPRRLVQIFIGVVYFGAAITKVHLPVFFTGDMLQYWMQTHINFQHPIGELLSLYPIMLTAFAYITLVWEFMFIFLAWKGSWRPIVLSIGILFHFMTTLTLGLLMFPVICYTAYLSFLDEEDVAEIATAFRRFCRRNAWARSIRTWCLGLNYRMTPPQISPTSSLAAFAFSIAFFTVVNVEAEYWMDLYGERRPEGRYALTPMDSSTVEKLLAPTEPLRLADRFFSIDIGTFLVGDRLANRRTEFRQGERIIAQCNLTPPHEDMYIECKMQNSDNRLIDRFGTIATRETFRTNFAYQLTDAVPPGEYSLTIESAGHPILRKKFMVQPRSGTIVTN